MSTSLIVATHVTATFLPVALVGTTWVLKAGLSKRDKKEFSFLLEKSQNDDVCKILQEIEMYKNALVTIPDDLLKRLIEELNEAKLKHQETQQVLYGWAKGRIMNDKEIKKQTKKISTPPPNGKS